MWSYSAPPMRLKSRPGLDVVTHGFFVLTFPYVMALLLVELSWTRLDWLLLGLVFLASSAGQLNQQIRDFDVDSCTDRNFTTTVGIKTSILWLKVTTVLTVLIASVAIARGGDTWCTGHSWIVVPAGGVQPPHGSSRPHTVSAAQPIGGDCLIYVLQRRPLSFALELRLMHGDGTPS